MMIPGSDSEKSQFLTFGLGGPGWGVGVGPRRGYPYRGGYGWGPDPYYSPYDPYWGRPRPLLSVNPFFPLLTNGHGDASDGNPKILFLSFSREGEQSKMTKLGVITNAEAKQTLEKMNIKLADEVAGTTDENRSKTWWFGMQEEANRGIITPATNTRDADLICIATIVLNCLRQNGKDYYHRLYDAKKKAEAEKKDILATEPGSVNSQLRTAYVSVGGRYQTQQQTTTTGMQGIPCRRRYW